MIRLLTIATVTPRKGHLLLAEALAALVLLDWRWRCIGSLERDPANVAALRAALDRGGIAARVDLVGEMPPGRLGEAYRAADCFVLPSFHEGYGMVFAEALAHGLPIVAARAGAVPELVPEEAGLLVPPGDVAALAAALRRMITEPELRRSSAAGARRAGAALPDWPRAVQLWGDAFARFAA
jgi:glycosyltransferase involved in cell wall biosynthesis